MRFIKLNYYEWDKDAKHYVPGGAIYVNPEMIIMMHKSKTNVQGTQIDMTKVYIKDFEQPLLVKETHNEVKAKIKAKEDE